MHHIGAPLRQVARDEGVNPAVSQQKIPDDPIGFLPLGQQFSVVMPDLDGLSPFPVGGPESDQENDQKNEHLDSAW